MTSIAKVQVILAFCLLVFGIYTGSLFILKRESEAGGHFTDKNGAQIKFFSMNPAENLRMILFICGKKTGVAKVDLLRKIVQAVFLIYVLFFTALALAINVASSRTLLGI